MVIGNTILFGVVFTMMAMFDNVLTVILPTVGILFIELLLIHLLITKPMSLHLLGLITEFYHSLDDSKLRDELTLMEEYFYTVRNRQRRVLTAMQVISIKKMCFLNATDQINVMMEYLGRMSHLKYKYYLFLNHYIELSWYFLMRDDIESFIRMYEETMMFSDKVKDALKKSIRKVASTSNLDEYEELSVFYTLYKEGYSQELEDMILSTNHNNYYSALYIYLMRNYYLSNDNMKEAKRLGSYLEKFEGNAKFLIKENG
jgi:hypothetical protein